MTMVSKDIAFDPDGDVIFILEEKQVPVSATATPTVYSDGRAKKKGSRAGVRASP
jgi:hypothetical protein